MLHEPEGAIATATSRGRGRPRLVEVDERILEATLDELCDSGVAGLTFDKLAARAGVAKTTIYRRWSSKVDLVIDAVELMRSRSPVPDTGNVRADLELGLENMLSAFTSPRGRAIAAVYAERLHSADLARAWQEKIGEPHMAAFRTVLQRAIAAGEVRSDVDVNVAIAVLTGPVFFALLGSAPPSPNSVVDVVDMVLDGLRPR